MRAMLGREGYIWLRFLVTHKYFPDFNNPRTFSEKIIYRKLHDDPNIYSKLVDKYKVREYVDKVIGKEHLIPLIKVCDNISPKDFEDIPESFVIKTSNGGGGEHVLIVEDKSKLQLLDVCNKFNSYIQQDIGSKIDEYFYDIEKPVIIFEELIKHNNGSYPSDYKIHIFGSEKVIIQVDTNRFEDHCRSLFDENLKRLEFSIQPKYKPVDSAYEFPSNIVDLISKAKSLSKGFKYVRVDMYSVESKIYFGELTFCHGSGWEPIKPKEKDFSLGNLWDEYK